MPPRYLVPTRRPDEAGNLVAVDAIGDMNCDGVTDGADTNAFILALTNPTQYAQTYPNSSIELDDINGDGTVNQGDIREKKFGRA